MLMTLAFLRTDDGWEAWEVFPDANAYIKHSENVMKCPFISEVFASQQYWDEVDGIICGLEAEIAKAP